MNNRLSVAPVHARHFSVSKSWRSQEDNKNGTKPPSRLAKTTAALKAALPQTGAITKRENIHTIPNWLTFSRLVAAPFIGYCILHDHHAWTLGLFAYAGVTDLLDGWIARRWNQGTVVGTIIDPMADKTLMTVLTVTLATKGLLPVWLAVIILGRDVALAISALYFRWISLPPPKTMARYWDFSLPSAEVRPTAISKYNTALQLGLMGLTTVAPVVPALDLAWSLMVMQYGVAVTTIWSGASYVYSKDAVKILTQPTTPKAAEKEEGNTEVVDEAEAKKVKDETATKQ
ncbi:CDP-alcohol phosphatidyltransferase-domain-containing protein [Neurospora tetraspora]|uniref:CDP-alcohol phosphatidyltransferase-domain-containing protein n=1 Tax=Neurospora tetraspora TaxID=94610 RepID=A0AAE0MQT0_9PEZI|nr:CDP-alcohol phosphatidyltransferase-domain-containing protein [Neurospora tetraspora]